MADLEKPKTPEQKQVEEKKVEEKKEQKKNPEQEAKDSLEEISSLSRNTIPGNDTRKDGYSKWLEQNKADCLKKIEDLKSSPFTPEAKKEKYNAIVAEFEQTISEKLGGIFGPQGVKNEEALKKDKESLDRHQRLLMDYHIKKGDNPKGGNKNPFDSFGQKEAGEFLKTLDWPMSEISETGKTGQKAEGTGKEKQKI